MSHLIYNQFTKHMAFEVQQFDFIEKQQHIVWKFSLGGVSSDHVDYYSQDENTRTLYNFTVDYVSQIEAQIDRKKKKVIANQRAVRKVCQKLLKSLKLKYSHFANDIQQEKSAVKKFFQKEELQQSERLRILQKTRKWVMQAWLSLSAENYFEATHKYLFSHTKDCKRLNPDYDLLNELYLVVIGDQNIDCPSTQQIVNSNKILVDINLSFDQRYISESFLWNPENSSSTAIENFINYFIRDILADQNISVDHQTLRDLQQDAKIQLKTQVCYKSLLKKYAYVLLNFSTMELSQDVKEYCIQIQLKLTNQNGERIFEDSFEWDILNEQNNVESFCQRLIEDVGLDKKYFTELCYRIKTQINAELEWKFQMLVKTYKSILRDRQSPKFHTQSTTTQIKKNLVYTMDVSLPFNPDEKKNIGHIYFNNSDLFSLLSRHMDILPQEFQEIMMCKQSAKNNDKSNKLTKAHADQYLKKNNIAIESNKYLGGYGNQYLNQNLWKKAIAEQK